MGSAYQEPKTSYNVIEFLLDDVGTDALNAYDAHNEWTSYTYPTTPNIDAVRGIGILFTSFWAHPVCSPDRAAAQTGTYGLLTPEHPNGTGIGWVVNLGGVTKLSSSMNPLGVIHAAQGTAYSKLHVGKWHLGYGQDDPTSPVVDGGNDEYRGCLTNPNKHQSDDPALSYTGDYTNWTLTIATDGSTAQSPNTSGYMTNRERFDATEIIPTDTTPFVLRVWFHAAHSPFDYVPANALDAGASMLSDENPATSANDPQFDLVSSANNPGSNQIPYVPNDNPDDANTDPNGYNIVWRRTKAMIESIDESIGLILADLTTAQRENTIIIIRADNGSDSLALTTVGDQDEPPTGIYDPDHAKQTVYEQGIKSPLIIGAHPSAVATPWIGTQNSTSTAICSTVDIFQTIADATLAAESKYRTDGRSLFPVMLGDTTQVRDYVFCFAFQPNATLWSAVTDGKAAVRDVAGNKLIRRHTGADELYNLATDPLEETPLTLSGTTFDALSAQLDNYGVTAP